MSETEIQKMGRRDRRSWAHSGISGIGVAVALGGALFASASAQSAEKRRENAQVRMTVAYNMAAAGDPEGAMLLMEEGLKLDGQNVDFLVRHAFFAYQAAHDTRDDEAYDESLSYSAREYYQKALDSYRRAYQVLGEKMDGAYLRNMVATYFELGQLDDAIEMAERALGTHPADVDLRSLYPSVLNQAGRTDDAIAALDQLLALDPKYPNVRARQGNWLLESGREDEALPYLQRAVANGEQTADALANLLFGNGYKRGIAPETKDYSYALKLFELAKAFGNELSDGMVGQLDFWHAYVLYKQGEEREEPKTLQAAHASLPKFQEAARLFALQQVAAYAASQASIKIQQFRDGAQQYIEIQSMIILVCTDPALGPWPSLCG